MSAIADEMEDLDALFERVAGERDAALRESAQEVVVTAPPNAPVGEFGADQSSPDIFGRIGKLTRTLHDALRELGYDKAVEKAVEALPDARDRLAYIATLTGQAADRTLGAIEEAKPIQEKLEQTANGLSAKWDSVLAGALPFAEFKPLVLSTSEFLRAVPQQTGKTNGHLLEIMMAQDFHDLTGQVIKKVVDLAQTLEQQMVQLLIETSQRDVRPQSFEGNLNGPVIRTEGRDDVVTNQAEVDALLGSLGF